jgi:hypothetical protein
MNKYKIGDMVELDPKMCHSAYCGYKVKIIGVIGNQYVARFRPGNSTQNFTDELIKHDKPKYTLKDYE